MCGYSRSHSHKPAQTGLAQSALLCVIPSGIAEMILLSDKAGAEQARVVIAHALRISITILILSGGAISFEETLVHQVH